LAALFLRQFPHAPYYEKEATLKDFVDYVPWEEVDKRSLPRSSQPGSQFHEFKKEASFVTFFFFPFALMIESVVNT
jgi:hypothetical protein